VAAQKINANRRMLCLGAAPRPNIKRNTRVMSVSDKLNVENLLMNGRKLVDDATRK
jgi:hypothetical protein